MLRSIHTISRSWYSSLYRYLFMLLVVLRTFDEGHLGHEERRIPNQPSIQFIHYVLTTFRHDDSAPIQRRFGHHSEAIRIRVAGHWRPSGHNSEAIGRFGRRLEAIQTAFRGRSGAFRGHSDTIRRPFGHYSEKYIYTWYMPFRDHSDKI